MSSEKLEHDWQNDPTLRHAAYDEVGELAEALKKAHHHLMGEDSGLVGYLYQQQVRRVRELMKELENERKR